MRIEEVNPLLNAVTEINPDALSIAAMLDAERANGNLCVPIFTSKTSHSYSRDFTPRHTIDAT